MVILGQVDIDDKPSWIQGLYTTESERKIATLVTETMTVQLFDKGFELEDMMGVGLKDMIITEVENEE